MIRLFCRLLQNDDGASLVEYALVVALIAAVAIVAVTKLGTATASNINSAATSL